MASDTTPPQHNMKSDPDNALEIAYSTISPKTVQQDTNNMSPMPIQIKLSLIDQNPTLRNHLGETSCESPFPMTPMTPLTPGESTPLGDMSKKQRHNLREQRRILRISNQFDILRDKLESAGYSSSKKDKFSVLQATLEYINHLERHQANRHGGGGGHTPGSSSSSPGLHMAAANGMDHKSSHAFMIDSMPSPVPALSMPTMHSFPMDLDSNIFGNANGNGASPVSSVECVENSTASYKDVFTNSSMPSLLAKLDGTVVEANGLFLELCCKNIEELRLHSLYTMCTTTDAPKMYSLVNKVLACEMATAQSKMMWHFSNTGDRKVFVSVSLIHDQLHHPANLHCTVLPLS